MTCSSIQIFLSAVFCPFLPSSTKPVASHLCAELCVDVQVYVCAEEMEKEAVPLPNADGGRLRAFGLLLHSLSRSLLLMASKTVKEHFQQSVLQIHNMPLNILGEGTDRGRQRM